MIQHIEYINTDYALTESSLLEDLKEIKNIPEITTVVLPQYFVKYARGALGYEKNISCLVDYPMGLSDIKNRGQASSYGIKNLANYIDIVAPSNYLTNRKYIKIKEDIALQKKICTNVRYILEYRSYTHQCLKKMTELLQKENINTVCISTGQSLDILSDSIIAAQFLQTQIAGLKVILSANFWNHRHFDMIQKNDIYAIRSSSIHTIKSFLSYQIKNH